MTHTKAVQTFKGEPIDLESQIISAIAKVGPRNVAELSRITGAHQETIRYKIKKRFVRRGFRFQAEVGYSKLGLGLHWGSFEVSPIYYSSAPRFFRALNYAAYLVHFSKILPQGHFVALFSLPEGKAEEFSSFLRRLKKEGIITNFTLNEVIVERHKPMDQTFFNFQADKWEVDWKKVKASAGSSLPIDRERPKQIADEIDMLIIKELQKDATQHIVGIARKLKVNEKTLEYHYRTHVVNRGLIPRYRTRWMKDLTKTLAHSMIIVRMTFKGLEDKEYRKIQTAISKIPFLWAEDLLRDGTYIATMNIPLADFIETNKYINEELGYLGSKVETGYMKVGEASNFTVPYEKFSDGEWQFDISRMEAAVVKELKESLQK